MFAPADGVPEDPATGSAAGPLAVHLARHGRIAFGEEIEISQGAEVGRPSTLFARADGSAERVERVEVGGSAVTVARGEFRLP
jgi:trans-2,3-dihydro-3-hydroxyanthranilate isomerase